MSLWAGRGLYYSFDTLFRAVGVSTRRMAFLTLLTYMRSSHRFSCRPVVAARLGIQAFY